MKLNKKQGEACNLFGDPSQDAARLVDHSSQSPCAGSLHHLQISTNKEISKVDYENIKKIWIDNTKNLHIKRQYQGIMLNLEHLHLANMSKYQQISKKDIENNKG